MNRNPYYFFFTHLKTNTLCSNPPSSSDEQTYITVLLSKCFYSLIHIMLTCQLQPTTWLIWELIMICSSYQTLKDTALVKYRNANDVIWASLSCKKIHLTISITSDGTNRFSPHIYYFLYITKQCLIYCKCTAVV